MLILLLRETSTIQWSVIRSYGLAFATRGLGLRVEPQEQGRPSLFTEDSQLEDKTGHCYWTWNDLDGIHPAADGCEWIWHHGPRQELVKTDPRILLLPRNDVFEIRGIQNTAESWQAYRKAIAVPWEQKRDEVYFIGHFTGTPDESNPRLRAFRDIRRAGLPEHVGVLAPNVPEQLANQVTILEAEPLWHMAHFKFVLSLWGNHPFNPRLYRGLEGGSLVFHQATPTIRFLDDGLLEPGRHYVEVAPDLSDLVGQVLYYMLHQDEAREIAEEGHRAWMENYFVETPYTMPDAIWERMVSQPRWAEFRAIFDV